MRTTETFEQHLRKSNLSENTIHSYLWTVDFYHAHYDAVSKENLLAYKGYLMEFFKPKTVNLRIQAMNKYLDFLHRDRLRLRAVKVQQKNFLENVISNADYNFLKKQLKKDGNMEWYFVVWYLAATGARVSELIQIKIEHVELGYFDLYTKGGKLRRLYIPKKLRTETLEWLEETQRFSGFLFLSEFFPGFPEEKNQNREQLQSAGQHIERKDQLGQRRKDPEVSCRTDQGKTGTHIV